MSTNCVNCLTAKRVSPGLLCDHCRNHYPDLATAQLQLDAARWRWIVKHQPNATRLFMAGFPPNAELLEGLDT